MNARWRHRPEGSTWGDFGPDDELGRLNLLTPERVLAGVREVKDGKTFCLSLPLDYPGGNILNPRRFPPRLRATVRPGLASYNFPMETIDPNQTDVLCDDAALIYLQYSTQWDSFAHCGAMFDADGDGVPEPLYYNGFRAGHEIIGPPPGERDGQPNVEPVEASALGIEKMAAHGIQGRGVLVDLQIGRAHV
jgi:hypothetical protein